MKEKTLAEDYVQSLAEDRISMEALYEPFYRKLGMRFVTRFTAPVAHPLMEFEMPRLAILHYRPANEQDYGISPNYWMLASWKKYNWVYHVEKMDAVLGNPRKRIFNTKLAIKAYRKAYPTMRWLKDDKFLLGRMKDFNSLIIINYGFMDKQVRYRNLPFTHIHKWQNKAKTFWKEVERIASLSERQQFIEWEIPTNIPTRPELNRAADELKRIWFKLFPTEQHLDLLDLWRWLDPNRRKLSMMSQVSDKHLYKINFVFTCGGNFCVLNLGKWNEWLSGLNLDDLEEAEAKAAEGAESDDDVNDADTNYIMMQKRFLRFLLTMDAMRKSVNTEVTITDENKQIEYHAANEVEVEDVSDDVDENGEDVKTVVVPANEVPSTVALPETPVENTPTETNDNNTNPELVTEKDPETGTLTVKRMTPTKRREIWLRENQLLAMLEKSHTSNKTEFEKGFNAGVTIGKTPKPAVIDAIENIVENQEKEDEAQQDAEAQNEPIAMTQLESSLTSSLIGKVREMGQRGAMSTGEMKRLESMAQSFKRLKNPYTGKGTLAEAIEQEIPEVEEAPITDIPDQLLVVDKSMLKTTTKDFDRKYIKHVMARDIMRSVLSVQKAGCAVTNYEITDAVDALNEFERHSIQVTPVGGATSTVHIKIPKIREDGTFKNAGSVYFLRKQRVDKILPSKIVRVNVFSSRYK